MGDLFENGPNWDFSEGEKMGVGDLVENVQDWLNDILGEGEWGS